jgi:OmpA-OmpF porin, OOP family
MKTLVFALLFSLGMMVSAQAQINVGRIIKSRAESRASQKIGQATDKVMDTAEKEVVEEAKKKPKKDTKTQSAEDEAEAEEETSEEAPEPASKAASSKTAAAPAAEMKLYSKYDFVPGDKVLFTDNQVSEETGEFPSRWDLVEGNAEIAELNGEKIINFVDVGTTITPLMSKDKYLPEVFTIEMDVYFDVYDYYNLRLWNEKKGKTEENGKLDYIHITHSEARMPNNNNVGSAIPDAENLKQGKWKHIALAFNKRSLKLYIDQYRLLNVPVVEGKPTGLSLEAGHYNSQSRKMMVRNIRIAEGGKDLYNRVMSEGKIVTHGITFDVNKSVIKPESMGTINQLVKLMNEQSDLKFEIGGHTDSDGDDASNLKLSQSRADAVKTQLVSLGIDASRLTTKGYGETKPLGANDSPEAKANNRRVEFVKK